MFNYNKSNTKILKTIWDYIGINPMNPYAEYFRIPENISFKKRCKCNQVWQNYIVTENGRISVFSKMERMKLMNATL